MKLWKKILLGFVIVLVVIQFIRPGKNIAKGDMPNDIATKYIVPVAVKNILDRSCYDCHSNNTNYPWYAEIQPVGWWLNNHVQEGKGQLNYNEFTTYPPRKQYRKMEETIDWVRDGLMPLTSYTNIHAEARLNKDQRELLIDWAASTMDTLKAIYPMDSILNGRKH